MFTLYIQGLHALDVAKKAKDAEAISVNRSVIDFPIEPTAEAIKLVGRWLDVKKLRVSEPNATIGPRHAMVDPDGTRTNAVLLASPQANAIHVLAINCVAIPKLGLAPEIFLFHAGFDAADNDRSDDGGWVSGLSISGIRGRKSAGTAWQHRLCFENVGCYAFILTGGKTVLAALGALELVKVDAADSIGRDRVSALLGRDEPHRHGGRAGYCRSDRVRASAIAASGCV